MIQIMSFLIIAAVLAGLVGAAGSALARDDTVVAGQSFYTQFAGFGKVRFVSHIDNSSGPGKCRFELRGGGRTVYSFPKPYANDWACDKITAISFTDVNGDGRKDVIVMAKAVTGIGPTGARPFNANTVYYNTGKGRFATVAAVNKLASKHDQVGEVGRALAKSRFARIMPQ